MSQPTFGTDILDELVDGVRIGDNLVVQGDGASPLDLIVDRFVAQATGDVPFVVVNLAAERDQGLPAGVTVLDWSPVLTGVSSSYQEALPPGATLTDALGSLESLDARVGAGAVFVFDRMTAVQEAWGHDAALALFVSACPRLYRRRSLALWPVERDAHRPTFLRRLEEITQVVVEVVEVEGRLQLTVRKADGRNGTVVGRTVRAEVVDGDLRATEAAVNARQRLGSIIRDQRRVSDMPQVELARRVGISPSALSQIERGVRGPAGDTLMRLWEVLGVPFGPPDDVDPGFALLRRGARDRQELQDGLTGERVYDDPAAGALWLLEFAPGATGDRSPFPVKSPETATVVRGILDLHLLGRVETLHEGDAVVASDAMITGWGNPGRSPTEVVWMIAHR